MIPLLADRVFSGDVSAYSLLMVAMGVGSITGALTVGTRTKVSRELITARRRRVRRRPRRSPPLAPTLPLEMLALGALGSVR